MRREQCAEDFHAFDRTRFGAAFGSDVVEAGLLHQVDGLIQWDSAGDALCPALSVQAQVQGQGGAGGDVADLYPPAGLEYAVGLTPGSASRNSCKRPLATDW